MTPATHTVGGLVRSWRERRRVSQLDLASDAEISQRHLSFIESGRSRPSREMVLHLAAHLEVPLRERNILLLAAGFAPIYRDRPLSDPGLQRARATIELILKGHEPFPALAVDRHWTMVAANQMVALLTQAVDPALLVPPVNVLRLSLHPRGLAPRIINLAEWRAHLLERLGRQLRVCRDPVLDALMKDLQAYPAPKAGDRQGQAISEDVAVPLRLDTASGVLSFLSTITVFGTPLDITLSELSLEAFYPADEATAAALHALKPRAPT